MNPTKTVLLIYGGKSVEHEISIRSAKNVYENIDKNLFKVVLAGIDKTGLWYLHQTVSTDISQGIPIAPLPVSVVPEIMNLADHSRIRYDIVFPVLHGTDGEDGAVQGIFKAFNVPLVGCSVLGSAVAMDKIVSKKLLKESGVPVADYFYFTSGEKDAFSFEKIVEKIGLPFMVKAGALGSSVGISKVSSIEEYETALRDSFLYGNQVLVEQFVKGRELECGVIGNEHPEATLPGEIILKKNYDFYNYQAKYQDEDAIDIVIPADTSEKIAKEIQKCCVMAYQALNCNDYARVDLFLTDDNKIIINEINTIPGFTNVSMFPMLWKNMGLVYGDLITKLLQMAWKRWESQNAFQTSYDKA